MEAYQITAHMLLIQSTIPAHAMVRQNILELGQGKKLHKAQLVVVIYNAVSVACFHSRRYQFTFDFNLLSRELYN